jgi:hypothetical protein
MRLGRRSVWRLRERGAEVRWSDVHAVIGSAGMFRVLGSSPSTPRIANLHIGDGSPSAASASFLIAPSGCVAGTRVN